MAGVPLAGTKVLAAKTPGPDQTPIKLVEMLGFIGGRLDQRWVLLSGGLAGRGMSVALASPYVGIELMIRTGTRRRLRWVARDGSEPSATWAAHEPGRTGQRVCV